MGVSVFDCEVSAENEALLICAVIRAGLRPIELSNMQAGFAISMTLRQSWYEFDVAVAAWQLGQLEIEELPEAARLALACAAETPSLVRLAVLNHAGWSEVEPVLRAVFDERGQILPSGVEAVCVLANDNLHRLVAGELDPRRTADRLRVLAWKAVTQPPFEDLLVFVGLSDVWDPGDPAYMTPDNAREAVLSEARALLARGGVQIA